MREICKGEKEGLKKWERCKEEKERLREEQTFQKVCVRERKGLIKVTERERGRRFDKSVCVRERDRKGLSKV